MSTTKQNESPLPSGWLEEIFDKVDLERSYLALRGVKHFYADGWRGRIRSEQLRFDAAWKYFDRAYELAKEIEETIPNLVRQFMLNIWCFENALLEAPIRETMSEVPEAWIPELPGEIIEEYPEVKLVIQQRRLSEAALRLHLGQYSDAAEIYGELIEQFRSDERGAVAFHYLGLAACEYNLEFRNQALKNLENAGLAISMNGKTWHRAKVASSLYAFYKYLKMEDEASSWESFLDRLPCPKVTKDLYKRRGKLILERCLQNTSLLLV